MGLRDALAHASGAIEQAQEALAPQVEGDELLPDAGPAIICFNHVTPLEWLLLPLGTRRVHFVGEARPASGLGRRLSGRLGRAAAMTPDDELAQARRILARGELLGIFPEGPRSPDGRLYRGRTSAARLALTTGVPMFPAAVLSQPGTINRTLAPHIVIGAPLDLDRFREMVAPLDGEASSGEPSGSAAPDELTLRTVTDLLMHAILELSGQCYVDITCAERREQLARERQADRASRKALEAARRAAEQARLEQKLSDREAEAAELAAAQVFAAQAARQQGLLAAEREHRRQLVRATRLPPTEQHGPHPITRERLARPQGPEPPTPSPMPGVADLSRGPSDG